MGRQFVQGEVLESQHPLYLSRSPLQRILNL